jgi:hypothetical protein
MLLGERGVALEAIVVIVAIRRAKVYERKKDTTKNWEGVSNMTGEVKMGMDLVWD